MDALKAKRDELLAQADEITTLAESETRGLSEDETTRHAELLEQATQLRKLIETRAAVSAEAQRALPELTRALDAATGVETREAGEAPAPRVEGETLRDPIYMANRNDVSYFMDVVNSRTQGDAAARERLDKMRAYNMQELQKRDLYNASTHGAEAIVPLYLQDRFEKYRLSQAITSGLTSQERLPDSGSTITVPLQDGSAAVASLTQASPLNTLQETDATFDAKSATVVEIGGTQDLGNFIVERGSLGVGVDTVIANHLAELLATDEDQRVLAAIDSGASISVTYTATTGMLVEIYKRLANCASQVVAANKVPPSAIVVHSRRFFSWAAELDSSNRPLMVPMSVAQNPLATTDGNGNLVAQGFTGYAIHGIPVYIDQNITILNGNPGTNQDIVYVCDFKKQYTWLGPIMVDLDRSVMFKNSGMTVRARRYMATMVTHRAGAFARITGTGLATPSFS